MRDFPLNRSNLFKNATMHTEKGEGKDLLTF